jgi:hypothetical protein
MRAPANICPIDLRRTAAAIAANYGDKGAIIITSGEEGIRVGLHGLDGQEAQEALCVAIFYAVSRVLD